MDRDFDNAEAQGKGRVLRSAAPVAPSDVTRTIALDFRRPERPKPEYQNGARPQALGPAPGMMATNPPLAERRRPGRRPSGFDDVEAAIAALQSSIDEQAPTANRSQSGVDPLQAPFNSRGGFSAANGNGAAEFPPLSDSEPLEDSPFASNDDLEEALSASRIATAFAWLAFLVAVAGLGTFAYFDRVGLVKALPGAAAGFAAFGAPVNVRGLEFSGIDTQWQIDGRGRPVLSLTGQVRNVTRISQGVPSVVFAFLDQDGRELFDWATPVRIDTLPPGEAMPFTTVVPAPPEAVRAVEIRFAKSRR